MTYLTANAQEQLEGILKEAIYALETDGDLIYVIELLEEALEVLNEA
jgi:hypothetical protein